MLHKREVGRQSYASLVTHLTDENHTLSIAVSLLPLQRVCCRPALFIVKYVTTLTTKCQGYATRICMQYCSYNNVKYMMYG